MSTKIYFEKWTSKILLYSTFPEFWVLVIHWNPKKLGCWVWVSGVHTKPDFSRVSHSEIGRVSGSNVWYEYKYFTHIYTHTQHLTLLNILKKVYTQILNFFEYTRKKYSNTQFLRILRNVLVFLFDLLVKKLFFKVSIIIKNLLSL